MNFPISVLFLVLGSPADPGVDFFYFEGERLKDTIEANFGLHGECREKGISMFASEGILLESVRANGKPIEPRRYSGIRHGAGVTIIEHPGPNFFYRMPLSSLESADPYDPSQPLSASGIGFHLNSLPSRLEISYRLRRADGSLSREYLTRGKRYPPPRYIKDSGG